MRAGSERGRDHGVHGTRQVRDDIPHRPERLPALVLGPEQQRELDHRPDLVQLELEVGDDTEVSAAAADRPEEIGVLVLGGPQDAPVGHDDLRRDQVVHREAALPGQPAHPAPEGEPADAGVADHPHRHGQAVRLGGGVEVGDQGAALGAGASGLRVDDHPVEPAQVDHQPVVAHGVPGHAVRATPDGDLQPRLLANRTAAATSAVEAQRAIIAGRRSMAAFQILRASS